MVATRLAIPGHDGHFFPGAGFQNVVLDISRPSERLRIPRSLDKCPGWLNDNLVRVSCPFTPDQDPEQEDAKRLVFKAATERSNARKTCRC